jgi:hypothetical protein
MYWYHEIMSNGEIRMHLAIVGVVAVYGSLQSDE